MEKSKIQTNKTTSNKNLYVVKEAISNTNRQPTKWQKISVNYKSDNVIVKI